MRTRPARLLLVVGAVLLLGAVAFRTVAVPRLVKYPADIDKPLRYTGTYTSYVDDKTLATRAQPLVLPFTLDRRLTVVHSTASTVVVREALVFHRRGLPDLREENQYVLDRYTMQLRGGPDSWALTPSNRVDRSGTYRVQLPMGTHASGVYPVWNNETSSTGLLVLPSAVQRDPASGLDVIWFSGTLDKPVTAAYERWLAASGFPTTVSSDQVQAQLRAMGVDVGAAFAAVGARLTAAESATLARTLATPVRLRYSYVYEGRVAIEPRTGTIISVDAQREGLAVAPDLSGVAALRPLLARYAAIPAVRAVSDGLDRLARQPAQLAAAFTYKQTPASSADVGEDASEQLRLMNLIELRLPWAVGLAGGLVLAADLALARRRRRRGRDGARPTPGDEPFTGHEQIEREKVGAR